MHLHVSHWQRLLSASAWLSLLEAAMYNSMAFMGRGCCAHLHWVHCLRRLHRFVGYRLLCTSGCVSLSEAAMCVCMVLLGRGCFVNLHGFGRGCCMYEHGFQCWRLLYAFAWVSWIKAWISSQLLTTCRAETVTTNIVGLYDVRLQARCRCFAQ